MFDILDCNSCPEFKYKLSDNELCHECIRRYHKKLRERDESNEHNERSKYEKIL